jgi:hypothetical protein
LWIPIKDSGWLNYLTAKANYPWTLSPVSGIHYIQAWAKDGAGNISIYPFQARVNYIPPSDRVGRDQTRIYRQNLTAGQTLHVSLTPASGDADLYIWAPDWQQGRPPWVSNLPNNQAESLSFVAPVSGEYQVEVYGYSAAQFQVSIQVVQVSLPSLAALFEAVKLPLVEGKTIPFAPALPPVSKPYIVLPPKQIFLPMVSR